MQVSLQHCKEITANLQWFTEEKKDPALIRSEVFSIVVGYLWAQSSLGYKIKGNSPTEDLYQSLGGHIQSATEVELIQKSILPLIRVED